jgi:hypothetical protein
MRYIQEYPALLGMKIPAGTQGHLDQKTDRLQYQNKCHLE